MYDPYARDEASAVPLPRSGKRSGPGTVPAMGYTRPFLPSSRVHVRAGSRGVMHGMCLSEQAEVKVLPSSVFAFKMALRKVSLWLLLMPTRCSYDRLCQSRWR